MLSKQTGGNVARDPNASSSDRKVKYLIMCWIRGPLQIVLWEKGVQQSTTPVLV